MTNKKKKKKEIHMLHLVNDYVFYSQIVLKVINNKIYRETN